MIDRDDGVVNVCEMKFSSKQYALKEVDDQSVRNAYANSVQSEVTLDDLFRA